MEDNSVIFAVDSGQCSEDEDDDLQRNEELHQLLSEQLPDDLLDDTMSTSIEGEISIVSTPQYSQSAESSQADLTPNASPSHDGHMTSPGQFTNPSQPYYMPESHGSASSEEKIAQDRCLGEIDSTCTEGNSAHGSDISHVQSEHYTEFYPHHSSGLTNFHLHPPLPSIEPLSMNETSDVFAGTSQAYRNNYYPLSGSQLPGYLPGNTERAKEDHHTEIAPLRSGLPNGGSQFVEAKNDEKRISGSPLTSRPDVPSLLPNDEMFSNDPHYRLSFDPSNGTYSGESDMFPPTGHAQIDPERCQADNIDSVTNGYPAEHAQSQYEYPTEHAQSQYNYSTEHAQNIHSHYSIAVPEDNNVIQTFPQNHLGVGQLEVLYDARGRQINELSQQLVAKTDDAERHVRILRHEKVLVETERDEVKSSLDKLEVIHKSMEENFSTLQGQLAAEKVKSSALENNKAELISRLQAAEATVNSLTEQVGQLTSSDTLSRIRDNYSQALSAAAHEHKQEVLSLQQESAQYTEQLEERDKTIAQLHHELEELQSNDTTAKQQLSKPPSTSKPGRNGFQNNNSREHSIIQQLEFGCEGCGAERVVEMTAQVEDLMFQLTTTQEELQQALDRVQQAEAELKYNAPRLSELELVNSQLSDQVTSLQTELIEVKVHAEAEKKAALEHCRSACLKLHEDSTQRMKETVATEKQKQTGETSRQIARFKSELTAVQEQYVSVCTDKERLEAELVQLRNREQSLSTNDALEKARSEWIQQQEAAVQEAVGVAKQEWRLNEETKANVESAMKEQEEAWQKRLETEKSQALSELQSRHQREMTTAREQWEQELDKESSQPTYSPARLAREKDDAVSEALRQARLEWLKEKEKSFENRIDDAVSAARKLWKEHHRSEIEKLKASLHSASLGHGGQRSSSLGAVQKEEKNVVDEAIAKTKQECERRHSTNLEQALAREKQKWSSENEIAWQAHEQSLIATAHKEWSTAQEAVLRAEVERSRQDWEESQGERTQAAVKDALLKAKQYYEGVVRTFNSDLSRKFESQKVAMAGEIQQLETKLATLMQQQTSDCQRTPDPDLSLGSLGQNEERRRTLDPDLSLGGLGHNEERRRMESVRELLTTTSDGVNKDVIALLTGELEASRIRHEEEIARVRESTANRVKQYYLQCLHQLVNDRSRDTGSESHDQVYKLRQLSHVSTDKSHQTKKQIKPKGNKTHGVELESHDPVTRSRDPYRTQKQVQESTIGPGLLPNSQDIHTLKTLQHKEDLRKHTAKKSTSSSTRSSQAQKHKLVSSYHGHSSLKQKPTKQHSNVHIHVTPGSGPLVQTSPSHRQCVACATDQRREVDVRQVKSRRPQGDAGRDMFMGGASDITVREGEKRTCLTSEDGRGSKQTLFGATSLKKLSKNLLQSGSRTREHSTHSS